MICHEKKAGQPCQFLTISDTFRPTLLSQTVEQAVRKNPGNLQDKDLSNPMGSFSTGYHDSFQFALTRAEKLKTSISSAKGFFAGYFLATGSSMNICMSPLNIIYTVYKHDKRRFDNCTLTIISSPLCTFLWHTFGKTRPPNSPRHNQFLLGKSLTTLTLSRCVQGTFMWHLTHRHGMFIPTKFSKCQSNLLGNLSLLIRRAKWFISEGKPSHETDEKTPWGAVPLCRYTSTSLLRNFSNMCDIPLCRITYRYGWLSIDLTGIP